MMRKRRRASLWRWLESHIHSIVAPAQLEPAAKMILDLELDGKRLSPILIGFSVALHQMSADDRAFTSSTHPELLEALHRLAQDAERKGVSSFGLVAAFARIYVRHLAARAAKRTWRGVDAQAPP